MQKPTSLAILLMRQILKKHLISLNFKLRHYFSQFTDENFSGKTSFFFSDKSEALKASKVCQNFWDRGLEDELLKHRIGRLGEWGVGKTRFFKWEIDGFLLVISSRILSAEQNFLDVVCCCFCCSSLLHFIATISFPSELNFLHHLDLSYIFLGFYKWTHWRPTVTPVDSWIRIASRTRLCCKMGWLLPFLNLVVPDWSLEVNQL